MVTVQRPPFLPVKPMRSPMKASLVLAVGLFLVIAVLNQSLKTEAAPQGIFSFQLAATAEQSSAILQSWGQENLAFAKLSLWLGLLFTVAWLASLLQLTRHFTRDRPGIRERKVARWVRVLFVIAGLCDVAENSVLLNNLATPTDAMSSSAAILALVKITGVMLGIAGLVVIRAARRHPLSQPG
ncbi:hypothetical protein B9Q17_12410 [Marinobacter vinifirmus]|jgi:hypothetical protein|uniref:Uncharacterized protein n=1 Tax=Marinobacter vinifirmus TaxID=355591 RepID=A0A7Z1ILX7_9GAMM|nr:hypothetical protein [Marinobacter vinifirmus]OZC35876.1 hypothetical protein B9Q17_12410 [Marinobacter vinifirmus]